jgi:hypothetical protein
VSAAPPPQDRAYDDLEVVAMQLEVMADAVATVFRPLHDVFLELGRALEPFVTEETENLQVEPEPVPPCGHRLRLGRVVLARVGDQHGSRRPSGVTGPGEHDEEEMRMPTRFRCTRCDADSILCGACGDCHRHCECEDEENDEDRN